MHASYVNAFWFLRPNLNSTEPQTRRTYLHLSIFTFEETLSINLEIVCSLQKQGKRFFSKALVYFIMMMMMMMIIIIIIIFIIIIYITFKGDFLSRQYFEMLVLFSYISITQSMGIDFCNWDIGTPVSNGYNALQTIFLKFKVYSIWKKAKLIKRHWLYFDCVPCSWNPCPFRSIRCAPLLSLYAVISGIKKNGRKRGYR